MNKELKTCPFCGSLAQTKVRVASMGGDDDRIDFSVFCENCGIQKTVNLYSKYCYTFTDVEEAMKLAIEEWNKRANDE